MTADHHVRRAARAAGAGPRDARCSQRDQAHRAGAKSTTRSSRDRSRAFSTATAATGIRSRTVTDYATAHASASRCRATYGCVASGELTLGFSRTILPAKDPARAAQGLRVHRGAAAALSLVHREPR